MRFIVALYLLLLGVCIGIEISIGAFLAPVIFFPAKFIGEGILTHFQSGQLMTQVFLKYNYILFVAMVFSFLFEAINLFRNTKEKFNFKLSISVLSLVNLILGVLFIFYFTSYILQAQISGIEATQTYKFHSIHSMSEFAMEAMLVVQILIFVMRSSKRIS